jgi:hypothetical protein
LYNHCFIFPEREKGNKQSLMLAGSMSLIIIVSQSSRKCWRCMFASSLGKPENWFAYTIVMRPVQSSKFPLPVLTASPMGTLATTGME